VEVALDTKLRPILERANVPLKLREIRKNLQELKEKSPKTPKDALRIQRLETLLQDMKDEFIFLVVDNK